MKLRLGDFELRGGRVVLRQTGNSARLDGALIREVWVWLTFYLALRVRSAIRNPCRRRRPSIWFAPDVPHPRYMVRSAAIHAGIRIARSAEAADAAFYFKDATRSPPVPPGHVRAFNFTCTDISKSHVAEVFASVFGYPLAVDPRVFSGDAVEKSETNGAHDGRIIRCPHDPVAGMVYQRLIDTEGADGLVTDLRAHCIGGRLQAVWIKKRPAGARFLPPNVSVERQPPDSLFSAAEQALIVRFAAAMGADWCAMDILRDSDGRIYVVDVNKTDAGPIIALPLREKLASTAALANALVAMISGA
jgi:hypothetical protein